MNNENIVYVKIKNGIFKCYKSEQMHKPIYYPVESKTNGYIDYNDVEKILTIEDLYQENQELKLELSGYRQAILKDKEMLGLKEDNDKLKKQLEYLRSGEYYNQLRFERDMLQNVVDKKEISKEDKEFIDMTQRNTELLEENQKLKKLLEEKNKPQIFIDTQDMEERYAEGLYQDYLEEENKKYKNQQKEFISYLENEKDRLARECSNIYEDTLGKTRFVNEDIFNEVDTILSKYKSIIGGKE